MDSARYQRLKNLMIEALEQPKGARERFVDEACGDDAALRADLLRLIRHSISDGFLSDSALAVDERQQTESIIGTTIGRIRIDRLIARGGMGEVYAGEDELLERPVAVKLIRSQWRWSEARRDAFLAEARALSALAHPNICQVHDFFSDDRRDVLVMELIDGRTLRDVLAQDGPPGRRTALEWARQIADALVSAHEQGITHRDLKPDNVMLTRAGQIKVLDFGLARSLQPGVEIHGTAPGTQLAGTPGYLAPEQARGAATTPASDIWSFGLLMIECLTGQAPFDKKQTGPSLLDQARKGEVRIPNDQPRAETRLLRSALAFEAEKRPSARSLRQQLRKILDRPKRRLIALAGLSLTVLLIAGVARYTLDLQTERNLAEAAKMDAEMSRQDAEQARDQAEELAQFMLEDLYEGLDEVGRLDLLEPVADKALEYFVTRRGGDREDLQAELRANLALLRSAQIMEFQGRLMESIVVMRQTTSDLRSLSTVNPVNPELDFYLSFGLQRLSLQLNTAGLYDESRTVASESLAAAQRYFQLEQITQSESSDSNGDQSRLEAAWGLLLGAWNALSESGLRAGDFELAISSADQALQIVREQAPDLQIVDQKTADLSWTRCLALLQDLDAPGKANACEGPLAIDQAQFLIDPDNVNMKSNLSNSLWLMSLALRQEGRYVSALSHAEDSEDLALELIAWDPEQPQFQNLLSVILISKARILAELEREDQRLAALEQALTLTDAMIGDGKDHQVLHNHATVLALLGRQEQARPWAALLMDSGWNRPAFILLCQRLTLDPRCDEFNF